jgi:adenylate cyclase
VTSSVVAAIQPNLLKAEIQRAQRKPTENLQAYDLMLRAWPHFYTRTRESLVEAERLLCRAIEIDPSYAPALAALASFKFVSLSQNWVDRREAAIREMIHIAQTALALDGNDPEVLHWASWIIALPGGDLRGGITLINKSIDLNPNNAAALQKAGALYAFAGDKQSAVAQLERSIRLNPFNRTLDFYFAYALAHFVAGEHEAAVEWTGKALQEVPNMVAALRYRAASLGLLGRLEEGRQVVQRILELVPDFTISRARRYIEIDTRNALKTPGAADSFYEGLRLSGVPE